MGPYVTDAHEAFRREVRDFAEAVIAPVAAEHDRTGRFPWDTVKALAERGYLGIAIPREYGGLGRDVLSNVIAIEELARVDASHAVTLSVHSSLGASPILAFGTPEQRERFLPLLAEGRVLAGFALTEPSAGSDAASIRTAAVRDGDGYRLDGSKLFITHGGVAELLVVTAVTDPALGTRGMTTFLVTKETAERAEADRVGIGHAPELEPFARGVSVGEPADKMGWRASDTRALFFQGAWVPESQRLGEEGAGFANAMRTLERGRIGLAAAALGLARGAFERTLAFTGERTRGGRPLRDHQGVRFALADMATEIAAARHLVYHAAWRSDRGLPFGAEAAMAKLYASELAMRATSRAVQLHGIEGYTDDHPVERMMRDAKIFEIGEGTSEIQRLLIARDLIRAASGAGD